MSGCGIVDVNSSLRKIVKGAALFFFGSITGLFIAFICRILVIRYITPAEFGLLSLSLTIFTIARSIANLGIPAGLTRQASYFLGRGETQKAVAIVKAGICVSLAAGISTAAILFFASNAVAETFKMQISWILKLLSLALPLAILSGTLVSVFQVYENVRAKVLFNDVLPNLLRLILVAFIVVLGLSFCFVVSAYFLSFLIPGIVFAVYALKNLNFKTEEKVTRYVKLLILFSLPLLVQSLLGMIINWTDTLMIGYFLTPLDVGLYSGARPLAALMLSFLTSINFLYYPIISQFYAKGKVEEVGRTYAIVTKWLMSVTLPVFLVMALFPKAVLWLLYGKAYTPASYALSVLASGFFVHVMLGPNGITLIAAGDVKYPTAVSAVAAVANVVLNLFFIPVYGIAGAALASAITYGISNVLVTLKLYRDYGIHPFTKNYVKPAVLSVSTALLTYWIARNFIKVSGLMLLAAFLFFAAIYALSLLVTKSFDKEDIMLLLSIESRLGVNLSWLKNILRRFV